MPRLWPWSRRARLWTRAAPDSPSVRLPYASTPKRREKRTAVSFLSMSALFLLIARRIDKESRRPLAGAESICTSCPHKVMVRHRAGLRLLVQCHPPRVTGEARRGAVRGDDGRRYEGADAARPRRLRGSSRRSWRALPYIPTYPHTHLSTYPPVHIPTYPRVVLAAGERKLHHALVSIRDELSHPFHDARGDWSRLENGVPRVPTYPRVHVPVP